MTRPDPFLEQLNKHYRGLLTKLDSIDEEFLENLLQKISDVASDLNDDPKILESEDFIRNRIKSTLREHVESQRAKILERGEEESRLEQDREERRQAAKQEMEDNPDSLEHGYEGQRLFGDDGDYSDHDRESDNEDSGEEFSELEYADDSDDEEDRESRSLGDLSDLRNLIDITTNFGEDNLSWLTNQIAEYENEDLWEYLIQKILENEDIANSLDPDLLNFIFYSASVVDSDDEFVRAFNSGSLARDYDDDKLVDGGFITDSVVNYLSELSIKNLKKSIEREFVYTKEIAENGDLREFRRDYNAAYSRHDLVTQNQLWSIFGLLQKKIKSVKRDDDPPILETLEEAKKSYRERADAYYFRTYPEHSTNKLVYSSKKERKVAAIDLTELLGELEEVGRTVGQTLKTALEKPDDSTNILAPILCFVVTDRAHRRGGDHRRIIVPLSLDLPDYKNSLLSKDTADEVFTEEDFKEFYELAKTDSDLGIKIIKKKAPSAKQDAAHVATADSSKIFDHSERVLFHALRKSENVKTIIASLKTELEKISGEELSEGKYKVYSAALLTYSTHGVCQYCSPTIIAHENHLRGTFLTALTEELNSSENFKTRGAQIGGSREKRQDRIKEKFHLSTIVTCDDTHSEQSIDMSDASLTTSQKKLEKKYHNSKSKIYLDHDAIDLHKHEITDTKKGRPEKKQHSFYEFVGARFSEKEKPGHDEEGAEFTFSGKTFMSGSKAGKLKDGIDELNESANEAIFARSAIKIVSLANKEEFVTR